MKRYTQERNIKVEDYCRTPWVFDMWSVGSILMEVLSGIPLWLSFKSRVVTPDGRSIYNTGFFGVAGRDNAKILQKQQQILGNGLNSLFETIQRGYHFTD